MAWLAWLGRRGSAALAVMVIVGVLTPPLGELLRPYVREAVFVLLTLAFLRTDLQALGALALRPLAVLAAILWTTILIPLGVIGALNLGAAELLGPTLALALLVQAVSLPLMSAPAIALLVGLDATPVLAGLLVASALMPATAPLLLDLGNAGLALPAWDLAVLLAAMLGGSALLGLLASAVIGKARIGRHGAALDGLNVLALFVFIVSVMGDVGPAFLADPVRVLGLTGLAFAVAIGLLAASWALFLPAGRRTALALALLPSQRNLGLMLAVMGTQLPETVWLYFAVAQLPIYLAPLALARIARP